jgi:hypothetical protein
MDKNVQYMAAEKSQPYPSNSHSTAVRDSIPNWSLHSTVTPLPSEHSIPLHSSLFHSTLLHHIPLHSTPL